MSPDQRPGYVRAGVASSALCAAVFGAMLLFSPEEMGRTFSPDAGVNPLVPLLGAALLGFAAMNWVARGTVLGGIYGRAVVVGNQTHFTIGALVLIKQCMDGRSAGLPFWLLTGLYVLGAGFFIYLTFFSSGLQKQS